MLKKNDPEQQQQLTNLRVSRDDSKAIENLWRSLLCVQKVIIIPIVRLRSVEHAFGAFLFTTKGRVESQYLIWD